ncbi:MAG: phosphoribosylanthranilate isomerase [Ruminiclostridium sp.]
MLDTKIKICGLTRMQDIEYVNEALPDYIGFVFAKSRRQIEPGVALQLKSALDSRIKATGVFVNENSDVIANICNRGIIDIIQLHGDENEEYINTLRQKVNTPIIKAIRVKLLDHSLNRQLDNSLNASLNISKELPCDFVLLDTYSDNEYGGTGKTFDWEISKSIDRPFFLAGGIQLENAKAAIEKAQPYCLDVSSGVETNGIKDRNKIIQLVKLVRDNVNK